MSSKKGKTKPTNNYYMGLALALARENAGLTKENPFDQLANAIH